MTASMSRPGRSFRRLASALILSTACALASTAASASEIPQPIGHPSKEEQEAFDREARLMPLAHKRALAIVDQVMADVMKLNARLEPELVNQTVTDREAASAAPPPSGDGAGAPGWGCSEPSKIPTKFTAKEAFDAFAKKREDSIATLRAELVGRYELFTKIIQQDQKGVLESRGWYERRGESGALAALAVWMRNMLGHETSYYQEQYVIAAEALLTLWRAEQSEVANDGGWSEYYTLTELMSDEADRAMTDFMRILGAWGCAIDSYAVPSPLGFKDPKALWAAAQAMPIVENCLRVREHLRDEFASRIRELRARLLESGRDIRKRLTDWRAEGIANHFYVGDGPAAVSAVFENPVPQPIGALNLFEGSLFVAGGPVNRARIFGGVNAYTYTVSIEARACGDDEAAYVIKFPDVEMPRAYSFEIEFDAPTVLESVVSGVSDADRL